MEMKRDSAACEPGKRPIDLVTSTATSELLAMASCGDGLDSRGILGTTAAGKVAKLVTVCRHGSGRLGGINNVKEKEELYLLR